MVIVRAFGDRPLVRRVWYVGKRAVYVTDDKCLRLLAKGKEAPIPIGFPREDVFAYNAQLAKELEMLYKGKGLDWTTLVAGNIGNNRKKGQDKNTLRSKICRLQHLAVGSDTSEINPKPPKRARKICVRSNKS